MKNKVRNLAFVKLFILISFFSATTLNAQNWESSTNSAYLKNLSEDLNKLYIEYQQSVETYAFERNILLREVLDNGSTISLIRIMPSGIPEFYKSNNQKAALNVGVTKLRPKAAFSLNLTGKNFTVGVWDSGSINSEHQELVGRVDIRDNIPFDDQ